MDRTPEARRRSQGLVERSRMLCATSQVLRRLSQVLCHRVQVLCADGVSRHHHRVSGFQRPVER